MRRGPLDNLVIVRCGNAKRANVCVRHVPPGLYYLTVSLLLPGARQRLLVSRSLSKRRAKRCSVKKPRPPWPPCAYGRIQPSGIRPFRPPRSSPRCSENFQTGVCYAGGNCKTFRSLESAGSESLDPDFSARELSFARISRRDSCAKSTA